MSGTKYTSDNRSNQVTINGKGPFIATVIRLNEQVDEGSTLVVDLATDKKLDENWMKRISARKSRLSIRLPTRKRQPTMPFPGRSHSAAPTRQNPFTTIRLSEPMHCLF